jgi:hypothetical protein
MRVNREEREEVTTVWRYKNLVSLLVFALNAATAPVDCGSRNDDEVYRL